MQGKGIPVTIMQGKGIPYPVKLPTFVSKINML